MQAEQEQQAREAQERKAKQQQVHQRTVQHWIKYPRNGRNVDGTLYYVSALRACVRQNLDAIGRPCRILADWNRVRPRYVWIEALLHENHIPRVCLWDFNFPTVDTVSLSM